MTPVRRRSLVGSSALQRTLGAFTLLFVAAVVGSSSAGAQGDWDDEFLLLGQAGDARIVSPVDGEVVDWPFTMVIEADVPGLNWQNLEISSPLSQNMPIVFDENGVFELVFDGPFPEWATSENWTAHHVEAFGSWEDPDTETSGVFFDDTILRVRQPEPTAPVITFDPVGPVSLPAVVSGTVTSDFEIEEFVVEHSEVRTEVDFEPSGAFTIDLLGPYDEDLEYVDDRVLSLLVRATDVVGSRSVSHLDLNTAAPMIAVDAFDAPTVYPLEFSGTVSHDGAVERIAIDVELDWDFREEVELFPQIADDGTWSVAFDPRFIQGWVWNNGDTLGLSFRIRDHAGRTAEANVQFLLPRQLLYCFGYGVTVDLLKGDVPTDEADIILGGELRDRIDAGGGDDVICSLGGWDIIDAGDGHDVVVAGNGRDSIDGGDGWDTIYGGGGADYILAGPGDDEVSGGRGNDEIRLGAGRDLGVGNEGNDLIFGGAGSDELFGRLGFDELYGGGSNDLLVGGVGPDKLFGGAGGDRLFGEDGRDRLEGGSGGDLILGGPGDDVILGGLGRDGMGGEAGNDVILGGGQEDLAVGGEGSDRCEAEVKRGCER